MCRCQGHLQRISCYNNQLIAQESRMQCFSKYFINNIVIIVTISMCISGSYSTGFCDQKTVRSVIVLDPGHGGFDNGAKGADNTLEKNITLSAANSLRDALEKQHEVVLTRTGDYWVDNRKRTEVANNLSAKLFISLHTGASFSREMKGISFIYFKPLPLKNKENTSVNSDIKRTEWDSIQDRHLPLSRVFAKSLSARFSKINTFGQPETDALQLSVLSGANMPAIIIEIGHLTNPADEQRLNNSDFLSDYMKEIASEIELFLKKYKNSY